MANITIAGDAVVVTSSLSLENLKLIEKYRPDALVLKGGEDGKEPVFLIGTTCGKGSINKNGAEFSGESHDDAKLATITMTGVVKGEDVKESVADALGQALIKLNKLEETLPTVLDEIAAEKAAVMENITLI